MRYAIGQPEEPTAGVPKMGRWATLALLMLTGCTAPSPSTRAATEFGGGGRTHTIATYVAEEVVLATTFATAAATFDASFSTRLRDALRDSIVIYEYTSPGGGRVHRQEIPNPFRPVSDSLSADIVLQPVILSFRFVPVASMKQAIIGTWGGAPEKTGLLSKIRVVGRRPGFQAAIFTVEVETRGRDGFDSEAEAVERSLTRLAEKAVLKLLR